MKITKEEEGVAISDGWTETSTDFYGWANIHSLHEFGELQHLYPSGLDAWISRNWDPTGEDWKFGLKDRSNNKTAVQGTMPSLEYAKKLIAALVTKKDRESPWNQPAYSKYWEDLWGPNNSKTVRESNMKNIMENWKMYVAEPANAAGIKNTGLFRAVRSEEEAINLNRMYVKHEVPIFEMMRNGNSLSRNFEHTVQFAAPHGIVFEVKVTGPINDHDEKHMVLAENINDMCITGVYSIKAGVWFTPEKFDEQFANIR